MEDFDMSLLDFEIVVEQDVCLGETVMSIVEQQTANRIYEYLFNDPVYIADVHSKVREGMTLYETLSCKKFTKRMRVHLARRVFDILYNSKRVEIGLFVWDAIKKMDRELPRKNRVFDHEQGRRI